MTKMGLKKGKKEQYITFSAVADNLINNSKLVSMTKTTLSRNIPETLENVILYPVKFIGVKLSSVVDYIVCMCLSGLATYYYFK